MHVTILPLQQPLYIPVSGRIHLLRIDIWACLVLAAVGASVVLRMATKPRDRGLRTRMLLPFLCMLVILDIGTMLDFRKQLHEALPLQQVNGLATGSLVRLDLRKSEWLDRVEAAETNGECSYRQGSDFVLPPHTPIVLRLVGRAVSPPFALMMTLSAPGPASCVKAVLVDVHQLGRLIVASQVAGIQ